jgi:hypothetical protein
MTGTAAFAEPAAMAGDPVRAEMLHAVMGGGAMTASKLARMICAAGLSVVNDGRVRIWGEGLSSKYRLPTR